MRSRVVRHISTLASMAIVAGCAANGPSLAAAPPLPGSAWTIALAQVGQDVQAGRHAMADRILVDFQRAHPAAPEAIEATYYRALYRLDPANASSSPREAAELFDSFLASPIVSPHHADAVVLRRVASTLEARAAAPPAVIVTQAPPRVEDARGKDEEITHLREELAKASAELERIKRRVATPKP